VSNVVHHIALDEEPDSFEFADILFAGSDAVRQYKIAAEAIGKLRAATIDGDRHAARLLLGLLFREVRSLEALYERDDLLPMFRTMLSETPAIPVLANSDQRAWKEIKELCDRLGLGMETLGIKRNPKGRAKHGVAANCALAIYRALK
jgi:hypothetical protein